MCVRGYLHVRFYLGTANFTCVHAARRHVLTFVHMYINIILSFLVPLKRFLRNADMVMH